MATVGHFTSMIGVFCFYITLLESSFERKLITLTHNLVPRMYNDATYIYLKNINLILNKKRQTSFPSKRTRMYLIKHLH
jgi:hypothetical protein